MQHGTAHVRGSTLSMREPALDQSGCNSLKTHILATVQEDPASLEVSLTRSLGLWSYLIVRSVAATKEVEKLRALRSPLGFDGGTVNRVCCSDTCR
jgi:hypothetical protein